MIGKVSFRNRSAQVATPATSLAQRRGVGRPRKTQMAQDRRSHKAMAET
jgi:hypothetical protein